MEVKHGHQEDRISTELQSS